jgi:hypothetical protein
MAELQPAGLVFGLREQKQRRQGGSAIQLQIYNKTILNPRNALLGSLYGDVRMRMRKGRPESI